MVQVNPLRKRTTNSHRRRPISMLTKSSRKLEKAKGGTRKPKETRRKARSLKRAKRYWRMF